MKKKLTIVVVLCLISLLLINYGLLANMIGDDEAFDPTPPMSIMQALTLGVVEGITEYLPVSSTGHLYLVERIMGISETEEEIAASNSYAISIQIGAILAVLWLYFGRIRQMVSGIFTGERNGRMLAINLLAAFIPAVVIGLALESYIKSYLFGMWPITFAWFVGGVVMLGIHFRGGDIHKGFSLEKLTLKQSLMIGFAQCLAMWPGVSRSLATIVAGRLAGMHIQAAVEFSFLLGLITLGSATIYEIVQNGSAVISTFGLVNPLIGLVAAFVSAIFAVKWLVSYLSNHGVGIFGYYRIALSLVVAVWLLMPGS